MVKQFRNIDKNLPQMVHIYWRMVTHSDEHAGRPDEHNEGFWPSQDENAAGYVRPEDYEEEVRRAEERMADWERGEWEYVGVVARAEILIPIGGKSFRMMTLESAGLWGIESDAGDYLKEVYNEQKKDLLDELQTLTIALTANDIQHIEEVA